MINLKDFNYKFLAGPFETEKELLSNWEVGNCRRAIQWYFFTQHNRFLVPREVLLPDAFHKTGQFVISPDDRFDFKELHEGDLIYANKQSNQQPLDPSDDDQLIRLHTAIYLGDSKIWHATSVEGKVCAWSTNDFQEHYRPIAAKRIIADGE
jgi:hypothetical protein